MNAKKFCWLTPFLVVSLSICLTTKALSNKIFFVSIPKCGTHLLAKCIKLLTGGKHNYAEKRRGEDLIDFIDLSYEKNSSCHAHMTYDADDAEIINTNNIKTLFIFRDPRDYVVSLAHYMKKNIHLWPHAQEQSLDELMVEVIEGSDRLQRELGDINEYYRLFMPWAEVPRICVVRFEDLVGAQGGGSDNAQIEEVKKIATYINVQVNDSKIEEVSNNLFGKTLTFRAGKIGSWKDYFKDEHTELFKEIAGQLLIDLGYENDLDW